MGAYISRHGSVSEGHSKRLARSLLQTRADSGGECQDDVVSWFLLLLFYLQAFGTGLMFALLVFKIKATRRATAHHALALGNMEKGYRYDVKEGVYHNTEKGETAKETNDGACLDAEKREKRDNK